MKKINQSSLPQCNFCSETTIPMYDAPTKRGSWAHMCTKCLPKQTYTSALYVGFEIYPQEPASQYNEQVEKDFIAELSDDDLEAMVMDSVVQTACPSGCEVEPDGECCHGYKSPLLLMGII